jgi:hypothetical protein
MWDDDDRYMQVFIPSALSGMDAAEALTDALGVEVSYLYDETKKADIIVDVNDEPGRFARCLAISMKAGVPSPMAETQVAARLAARLNVEVLVEVESDRWLVAGPGGVLVEVPPPPEFED